MQQLTRKQREFARREKEILRTALHLFDSDDWESVTIEQIALQTDIGKGTVYKHFASKDHIYARLALDFYYELLDNMRAAPDCQCVTKRMREMLQTAFDFHLSQPQYRRVTQYCHRDDFRCRVAEEINEEFRMLDLRFGELTVALLEQGIADDIFPRRPAEYSVYGLHACFEGAMKMLWCADKKQIDTEIFTSEIIEFMMAGLINMQPQPAIDY
ncbi:MAG: TetR/AcrR family transcriptional regulator [Gammaproteobacteria bacterium]|nr:TetR/AcrR family transcriptional regulator [Gammaproteobacteria bacterium]